MLEWFKSRGIAAWIILGSIVLAFIGLIIYIATSTTGYLAGTDVNAVPIVFTFIAMIALAAAFALAGKLSNGIIDLIIVVSAILLIFSFALFILERVDIIGEVNFMIINVPDSEVSALNTSIVGFVFYGLSVVALAAGAFFKQLTKNPA